jgi:hypothetical protein
MACGRCGLWTVDRFEVRVRIEDRELIEGIEVESEQEFLQVRLVTSCYQFGQHYTTVFTH